MFLAPTLFVVNQQAPDYICERVEQVNQVDSAKPLSNEVLLVSGFGPSVLSPTSIPEIEKVLHATVEKQGLKWKIFRAQSDTVALHKAELQEEKKTFDALTAQYQTLATQMGKPLGSPELTYKLAENYAEANRIHATDPSYQLPWYPQLTARPVEVLAMSVEKSLLDAGQITVSPYQNDEFAQPPIGDLKPLNVDLAKALTLYETQTAQYNQYVKAKGQPDWKSAFGSQPGATAFQIEPIPSIKSDGTLVFKYRETGGGMSFTLQFYGSSGILYGGGDMTSPWILAPQLRASNLQENQMLKLSPKSAAYLSFVTYRHSKQPDYFINGEPVYRIIYSNKADSNPAFYHPEAHDPLSYYVADLVVQMAHALGYDQIVGDLPDSLLNSFTAALKDSNGMTVSQVELLLKKAGLNLIPNGDILTITPAMPEVVEAIRGSRKPYEDAFHLIRKNGSLTLRELSVFRAETEVSSMDRLGRLQPVASVPVFDQENFKAPQYGALCIQPYVPFFGTLSDQQWQALPESETVASNETSLRQVWWKAFFYNSSSVDPRVPAKGNEAYSSGTFFTLEADPLVEFANLESEGYPIRIDVKKVPYYRIEPSFDLPLANPPFYCGFFRSGDTSGIAANARFVGQLLKGDLADIPDNQLKDFIAQYVRFRPVTHEEVTYGALYPGSITRYGSVDLNLNQDSLLRLDQLPKDDQKVILQEMFPNESPS